MREQLRLQLDCKALGALGGISDISVLQGPATHVDVQADYPTKSTTSITQKFSWTSSLHIPLNLVFEQSFLLPEVLQRTHSYIMHQLLGTMDRESSEAAILALVDHVHAMQSQMVTDLALLDSYFQLELEEQQLWVQHVL